MPIDNDCLLLRQIDTRRLQLLPSPIFRRSSSDSLINDLEVVEEQTRTIHFKSEPDVTFRGGGRVGSSVSTTSFGDGVEENRLGTEIGTGAGAGSGSGTNMPFDDDDDGACSLFLSSSIISSLVPRVFPFYASSSSRPPSCPFPNSIWSFHFSFCSKSCAFVSTNFNDSHEKVHMKI